MNVEISLILQSEEEEGTNEKKKINPILLINACSFTFFFCFQQRNQSSPVSHILFLPILLSSF